jgi:hypothetical protein
MGRLFCFKATGVGQQASEESVELLASRDRILIPITEYRFVLRLCAFERTSCHPSLRKEWN